jgi:radical SAM protein with 4Fe4S-binding SPASM domain
MRWTQTIPHLTRLYSDYRRQREVVRTPPIRLWVETASHCNLRCVMCPNKNMPPETKQFMDPALFRKIVDEARTFANDIYLHHRGEPLLNPHLFDMIAYARAAGLNTRFHTNGALLTEDKAERLLDAGPDLVSFSIDGFDKEAYERVRVGATFETTVENVIRLARRRTERGANRPYLVVEKIRFRNPQHRECPEAVNTLRRRFLDAGINEVIEKEEYVWTEPESPEMRDRPRASTCTFPWYAMVICANGTVTPCPQDFHGHMAMGNAAEASLLEIWNGPAYRKLRAGFRDVATLPLCRKCDRLQRRAVGGVPLQYAATFLIDHLVGYNRLRRWLGTSERND